MKNTTKRLLVLATALSILLIAAQEVRAGAIHDVRTEASAMSDWNNPALTENKSIYKGKHARKKFVAQKKKRSSKKKAKDRTTSNLWMFETKNA
ncbi:MAG TPA: hypothetical protein PKZ32_10895 [Candidatus Melainabacteria bacterium]|nr:hypothetical protein [Candidatus Melainabacteria bacterium]